MIRRAGARIGRRLRLTVLVARPPVVLLLVLFALLGMARTGQQENLPALARVLVVVLGFLVFSVACNDLADQAIDVINLPGDRRRPLVAGLANRREVAVTGVVGGLVAIAASVTLRWPAVVVCVAGLALSAGYSLRPVRLADRGAIASMALPFGYVAVPYLTGVLAGRAAPAPADLAVLAGLYVGFIGRILLKDFRDLRGDAMFGKRTFLVRHGRRWTCLLSAVCWVAGAALLLAVLRPLTPALLAAGVAMVAATLGVLAALSSERGHRRDERLIATAAVIGRGWIVTLLVHLATAAAGWPALRQQAVVGALALLTLGQAAVMARYGPRTRTTPAALVATRRRAGRPSDDRPGRDEPGRIGRDTPGQPG